jgi:hypothetical protein
MMLERTIRSAVATVALVALAACAVDRGFSEVQRDCTSRSKTLRDELACTKAGMGPVDRLSEDIRPMVRTYLVYGDSLAERVEQGRLTEVEARQDLRVMYQRLKTDVQSSHPYWLYWLWPS